MYKLVPVREPFENEAEFKELYADMKQNPIHTFRRLLLEMEVLEVFEVTYDSDLTVSGIDLKDFDRVGDIGYPAIKTLDFEEIDIPAHLLIDHISLDGYGFVGDHIENQLIQYIPDTEIKYQAITVEPFKQKCTIFFQVYGDLQGIYDLGSDRPFRLELWISACRTDVPYWKQSLYLALQMREIGNIAGAFMHLFIALDGLVQSITAYHPQCNEFTPLYQRLLYIAEANKRELPLYVSAFREARNAMMHGDKPLYAMPKDKDILILLLLIWQLDQKGTFYQWPHPPLRKHKRPKTLIDFYSIVHLQNEAKRERKREARQKKKAAYKAKGHGES